MGYEAGYMMMKEMYYMYKEHELYFDEMMDENYDWNGLVAFIGNWDYYAQKVIDMEKSTSRPRLPSATSRSRTIEPSTVSTSPPPVNERPSNAWTSTSNSTSTSWSTRSTWASTCAPSSASTPSPWALRCTSTWSTVRMR